jgi:hypothetical protein
MRPDSSDNVNRKQQKTTANQVKTKQSGAVFGLVGADPGSGASAGSPAGLP